MLPKDYYDLMAPGLRKAVWDAMMYSTSTFKVDWDINMPSNVNVRIWWDPSVQAYRFASSYSKEIVDFLGKSIPVSDRSWDPTTKIWTFVEKQLQPILGFLKLAGVTPVLMTRQQVEAASQAKSNTNTGVSSQRKPLDTVLIEFVRLLPYDAAKTAYRKAALELHPDRGGDASKAASLNDAWTRISKEVYGQ